jgi:hypothetical protein
MPIISRTKENNGTMGVTKQVSVDSAISPQSDNSNPAPSVMDSL